MSTASAKRWSQLNPEAANLKSRQWRKRNIRHMLHLSARRRALLKGIEFSITLEDVPEVPDICPIALIPIFPRDDGSRGPCDNSPTLDRKNPELGYIKGNVFVISHRGNRWKGEMTEEELIRVLNYMRS